MVETSVLARDGRIPERPTPQLPGQAAALEAASATATPQCRWESHQDVSQTGLCRGVASVPPSLSGYAKDSHSPDSGLSSLAASYLNPVKSFVPQMPKLLKSLFPIRDEKRGQQPSPLAHQARRENEGISEASALTVVKSCDRPTRLPPQQALPEPARPPEVLEGPPSPLSEASSGYFSHSVSTATLSDALAASPDAAAQAGRTPSSPPTPRCQTTPEAEPACPATVPWAETRVPAQPPLSTRPLQTVLGSGASEAAELASSEKPSSVLLGAPQGPMRPATSLGLDVPTPPPPDCPPPAPAPASPFRIQKVRTSELKSFTRMLGGDPSCSPGAEGHQLGSVGLGGSGSGGQALEQPEVASDSEEAAEVPEWLREGEHVTIGANRMGTVRYIGPVDFQEGPWVGVELDLPSGKNDGSVGGRQYFRCSAGHGLLVRPGRVRRAGAPSLASLTALAKAEGGAGLRERSLKSRGSRQAWAS